MDILAPKGRRTVALGFRGKFSRRRPALGTLPDLRKGRAVQHTAWRRADPLQSAVGAGQFDDRPDKDRSKQPTGKTSSPPSGDLPNGWLKDWRGLSSRAGGRHHGSIRQQSRRGPATPWVVRGRRTPPLRRSSAPGAQAQSLAPAARGGTTDQRSRMTSGGAQRPSTIPGRGA